MKITIVLEDQPGGTVGVMVREGEPDLNGTPAQHLAAFLMRMATLHTTARQWILDRVEENDL